MAISSDLIRGHLEVVILKMISEKDRYAYDLSNQITKRSQAQFTIKEATLYAMVQRLEKKGLIESYIGTKSKGSKRRYYTITTLGKAYYQERLKEWQELKSVMTSLLEDTHERD